MSTRTHWGNLYANQASKGVNWSQRHADISLRLIEASGVARDTAIGDMGGGASILVDDLRAAGCTRLSVLDLSAAALQVTRERLGTRASVEPGSESTFTDLP